MVMLLTLWGHVSHESHVWFESVGGQKALMATVWACNIASKQTQAVRTSPEAVECAHILTLVLSLSPVNL